MEGGTWDQERLEAFRILRSLNRAYSSDEAHQRSLMRNWPEWPRRPRASALSDTPDPGMFIPETIVRDEEDASVLGVRAFIQRCLQALNSDKGQVINLQKMQQRILSDWEIVRETPFLLEALHIKALQSILSILSGRSRNSMNRSWLIEKIRKDIRAVLEDSGQTLPASMKRIVEILRDPDSLQTQSLYRPLVLNLSSPRKAVRSALDQLEFLPLRSLHIMAKLIQELPPSDIRWARDGGSKDRLVATVKRIGVAFLADIAEGHPLPEPLRQALIVMSLSAKVLHGNDGNLMQFLGPISQYIISLQNSLISALAGLQNLNYEDSQRLYYDLVGDQGKVFKKKHPTQFREPVRKYLFDSLLKCSFIGLPNSVIKVLTTRQALISERDKVEKSKVTAMIPFATDGRVEQELEAALTVSSHLQQIMLEWKDHATHTHVDVPTFHNPAGSVIEQPGQLEGLVGSCTVNGDECLTQFEGKADNAAIAGYVIIGHALEEFSRRAGIQLKETVRTYLRSGVTPDTHPEETLGQENVWNQNHEVDVVFRIAGNLPIISTRVLENARRRLRNF